MAAGHGPAPASVQPAVAAPCTPSTAPRPVPRVVPTISTPHPSKEPPPLLTAGRVAHQTGLIPKAVRLYEAHGLIDPPARTASGCGSPGAGTDSQRARPSSTPGVVATPPARPWPNSSTSTSRRQNAVSPNPSYSAPFSKTPATGAAMGHRTLACLGELCPVWKRATRGHPESRYRPIRSRLRSSLRRDALGRRGHRTRLRTPASSRPTTHRPDLVRRRRSPGPHPVKNRRPRIAYYHPALPAPGRAQDHFRWRGTLGAPERAARPALPAEPDHRHALAPVKGTGPQLVPKHDQGPVSESPETGPDPRLSRVGTTGFEPATP